MYQIVYRQSAKKSLRRIPKTELNKIVQQVLALAQDPRPHGSVKLRGANDLYRIRQGDYRIVYKIEDAVVTVTVIKIGHRKDVYNKI